ncbi:MAG: response regulator [Paenibacillaceae bacterium]|nr:response regulator [Paenibacillaceae bacterium]
MRIRTKLFIGFGALIFLMFALAGVGLNRMTGADKSLNDNYKERFNQVKNAYTIRNEISTGSRSINSLLTGLPDLDRNREYTALNDKVNRANALLKQLGEGANSELEEQLVDRIGSKLDSFIRYKDELLTLLGQGKDKEALTLRQQTGLGVLDDLYGAVDELGRYNERAMDQTLEDSQSRNRDTLAVTGLLTMIGLLLGIGIMFWIIFSITGGLNYFARMITDFAQGTADLSARIPLNPKDEIGELAIVFNRIARELEEKTARERELAKVNEEMAWLKSNVAQMTIELQELEDVQAVASTFLRKLAPLVGASCGALYVLEDADGDDGETGAEARQLVLSAAYARLGGTEPAPRFALGEGLIGQCALEQAPIELKDVPQGYVGIVAGLGAIAPATLLVYPACAQNETIAVFELAAAGALHPLHRPLLEQLAGNLAVVLGNIRSRNRMSRLLRVSQALTEELQTQSEELRMTNEKLEEHTHALLHSEDMLQRQQEALEISNADLKLKTMQLEERIEEVQQKNRQIEQSKRDLERQAAKLGLISKYKTEFLANMSHELRTPLNSLLILSQLLAENKEGNLQPKQREYASTIYSSGRDLLKLIDEVLDLSKIEAGKMDVSLDLLQIRDAVEFIESSFHPVARKKSLDLSVLVREGVPAGIWTDSHRVKQIVRNLLSNAFKFTREGGVTVEIRQADREEKAAAGMADESAVLAISVTDTGIGVPREKQALIFEAFQQADGTTSRHYGGTGLGLSISRELARLLGGVITLCSEEGRGSSFTLYLPERTAPPAAEDAGVREDKQAPPAGLPAGAAAAAAADAIIGLPGRRADEIKALPAPLPRPDASEALQGKRVLLVDDDMRNVFAIGSALESAGLLVSFADNGGDALRRIERDPAGFDLVLMDIMMPGMDGNETIRAVRALPDGGALPIIAITANSQEADRQASLAAGASGFLQKPVQASRMLALMAELIGRTDD